MKQIIGILLALTSLSGMLKAQPTDSIRIEDLRMERNGNYLTIQMNVVLIGLKIESNRAVLLTPSIMQEGTDTLALPSVAAIPAIAATTFVSCYATAKLVSLVPGSKWVIG